MPWLKAAQTVWNLIPAPELHSGNLLSMLCRVVRVKNSERQSCKGCKQGGTVGKALTPEKSGVKRFFVAQ